MKQDPIINLVNSEIDRINNVVMPELNEGNGTFYIRKYANFEIAMAKSAIKKNDIQELRKTHRNLTLIK